MATEAAPLTAGSSWSPLPRDFYARPTATVAQELLGKLLVQPSQPLQPSIDGPRLARIVEVEAYLGVADQASHARRGPTPRAAIMFGPPGHLYVYLIYGMHHCMNFVTEPDGIAGAVLIRAAEPIAGFHALDDGRSPSARWPLRGPGKVCQAFGITVRDKGLDLTLPGPFFVTDDSHRFPKHATSARIGVGYAGLWARRRLRFYVPGNPHVSGKPR